MGHFDLVEFQLGVGVVPQPRDPAPNTRLIPRGQFDPPIYVQVIDECPAGFHDEGQSRPAVPSVPDDVSRKHREIRQVIAEKVNVLRLGELAFLSPVQNNAEHIIHRLAWPNW
jgi:hypothetical protein